MPLSASGSPAAGALSGRPHARPPPPTARTLTPTTIRYTVLQSFARDRRTDERRQRDAAWMDRRRPHGLPAREPAARGRARRRGVESDPREGRAARRAGRRDRRRSGRPRRPRRRLHDGRGRPRLPAGRDRRRRAALAQRRGSEVLVDSTTISPGASQVVRDAAREHGTAVLAAPVSGNPKVVAAGKLTIVASGPREAFDVAEPYLRLFGAGVTYVGDGDRARLVKICHNLMLGIVAQTLAEIAVLAEKGGVSRADLMAFLNDSVMGSMFTRYKTPA